MRAERSDRGFDDDAVDVVEGGSTTVGLGLGLE